MCVDTLIQLNSLYFSIPHAIFQNVNTYKIQLWYSGLLNTQNPSISVNMQKADYDLNNKSVIVYHLFMTVILTPIVK